MLTHFSLFTGIGGIDLAAEWAGFESAGQCEWADYQTKVLEKHWPDVPRWRDIRDVTAESFKERTGLDTVTLVSGGFPCQPFSVAGKQRGKEDDRYLWPEMCRVIEELRPTWVLGENVAGIVRMALDTVLSDLEAQGYTTIPFIIPACGVDAQHKRERVFIVAHAGSKQLQRCSERQVPRFSKIQTQFPRGHSDLLRGWGLSKSKVLRNYHGVPNGVDRIKCLGNAVVPQQVYPILKAIAQIELKEEI